MTAGKAIADEFKPWKMNYSCYGNQAPHIHWHLFPRYESDPKHLQVPWVHALEFETRIPGGAETLRLGERIAKRIGKP